MTAGIAVSSGPPGLGRRRIDCSPSKRLRDADRAARRFATLGIGRIRGSSCNVRECAASPSCADCFLKTSVVAPSRSGTDSSGLETPVHALKQDDPQACAAVCSTPSVDGAGAATSAKLEPSSAQVDAGTDGSLMKIAVFAFSWLDDGHLEIGTNPAGRQRDLLPLPNVATLRAWTDIIFSFSDSAVLKILNGVILGLNALYSKRGFAGGEHLTTVQSDDVGIILGKLQRLLERVFETPSNILDGCWFIIHSSEQGTCFLEGNRAVRCWLG